MIGHLPRTFGIIPGWFAHEPFRITNWSRHAGMIYCECEAPYGWGCGKTVEDAEMNLRESLSEALEELLKDKDHLSKYAKDTLREFLNIHKCERTKTFATVEELIRSLNNGTAPDSVRSAIFEDVKCLVRRN